MIWLNHLVKQKKHRIPKAKKNNIKKTQGAFDGYHDLGKGTCNDIDTISVLRRESFQLGEVVGGKAVEGKGIGRMEECKLGVLLMIHIVITTLCKSIL